MTARLRETLHAAAADVPAYPVYDERSPPPAAPAAGPSSPPWWCSCSSR